MICGNISNFFFSFFSFCFGFGFLSFLFCFLFFSNLPPPLCFGPLRILRLKEIEAIDSLTFSCFTNASHYLKTKPKKPKLYHCFLPLARGRGCIRRGGRRMPAKPVFGTYQAKSSSGRPNR